MCFLSAVVLWLVAFSATATDLPGKMQRLVSQLGDKKFARREAAQQELVKLGDANHEAVLAACVNAYAQVKDPEVKCRLRDAMRQLVETHVLKRPRGFLGIRMTGGQGQPFVIRGPIQMQGVVINGAMPAPAGPGIPVMSVTDDSPASRAGLQAGDQILKIDEIDLVQQPSTAVFTTYVQAKNPGTTVKLVLQRGEQTQTMPVELGKMPDDLLVQVDPRLQDVDKFFADWLREKLRELTIRP